MLRFQDHINGDKPVIVDFYADWCQPCKMMAPILREVKDKIGDKATLLKLDVDKSPYYSQLYNIVSTNTHHIPTREGAVAGERSCKCAADTAELKPVC